ncbi:MAG TPA: S-layer protein, partial [Verrucomicrobia bacterium]|nr:S-layer protein [Verrucomicrobiota bacterium]
MSDVALGQAAEAQAEPILVFPAEIVLAAKGRQQLLVQQRLANGLVRDLSRDALFSSSDPSVVSVTGGVVRAAGEGLAKVRVEAAGQVASVDVFVGPKPSGARLSFVADVLPVLGRAGCANGGCHAKPKGQNGFSLSVFSFDPAADFREIVKDERGRRVFPAFPAESLLLKKPTLAVEHEGGKRLEVGSPFYQIIHDWISQGMVYQREGEPELVGISVFPNEQRYAKSAEQQLVVTARFADGSTRDVTHLAGFSANEKELAEVDETGLVRVGTLSGEGIIVVRFLGQVARARITVPTDRQFNDAVYAGLPRNNFIDDLAYARFQKLGL